MTSQAGETLAAIAAELYVVEPAEFIAARNARAAELADAALGKQVRALRKPSVAAWVVNLFARERNDELAEALGLAEDLREAQADLDARELAKLGRERRRLTQQLAQNAAAVAENHGGQVSSTTLDAVLRTLNAAFFDPAAATAVLSGRLMRTLEPADTADPADAVAGALPDRDELQPEARDEVSARRRRREAERALAHAEKEAERARKEHSAQEERLSSLDEQAQELAERTASLEAQLKRLRAQSQRVEDELPEAAERRDAAAAAADAAERAVEGARSALEAL